MSARDSLRKGWCPGALRPMTAKDGLLVRLRITGGIVPTAIARAIAACAERHGNGLLDLSARGNLQMRGISEATLPMVLDDLRAQNLLDGDAGGEAVRNVVASPLAGCHAGFDIRPLTAALGRRLTQDATLHALPGKFGFLIDDGGAPSLAGVAADVRFDWCVRDGCFDIGLGGSRATAVAAGRCSLEGLVEHAVRVAQGVLGLFAENHSAEHPASRLRQLIEVFGADAVARVCGAAGREEHDDPHPPPLLARGRRTPLVVVGHQTFAGRPVLGLGVPFGRLDAAMLRHAAALAEEASGELRLTPWRAILVPGAAPQDLASARGEGFIVAHDEPRRGVAACVGREGCARATTPTHADATQLADIAASLSGDGIMLHVSGCEKGCAKPSATAITLVGRDGRYDLVRNGRADDAPSAWGLDLAGARAALLAPA